MLAHKQSGRGMTMLEVLTASAIMAVTMSVATSVFVTVVRQRRENERLLQVQSTGIGAYAQIQVDLTNAGYRFPSPAFGVRAFNNVTQLSSGGASPTFITQTNGCGTGGLAPGSDAVETVQGTGLFQTGTVQNVTSLGNNMDYDVLMVASTPFTVTDVGPSGVALFYDSRGESCIGEVLDGPGGLGGPRIRVRMLTRDFEPVTNAASYYPNSCPSQNMSIYRFASRRRFFLCQETVPDAGPKFALYSQSSVTDGGYLYDPTLSLLQDGVEDFQVSARVNAGPPSFVPSTGTDCEPAPVPGGRGHCSCNVTAQSACDLNQPTYAYNLVAGSPASNQVGVVIELTSLGAQPMADGSSDGGRRPASFDHPAGTTVDGFRRLQNRVSIGMNNITQVKP